MIFQESKAIEYNPRFHVLKQICIQSPMFYICFINQLRNKFLTVVGNDFHL